MQISTVLKERTNSFCRSISLHGLKYVGQSVASTTERLFWILSFASAVGFASYFISSIFEKYYYNRVIVGINSQTISSTEIPFPTVTICNMNRVNRVRAEELIRNGSELKGHIDNLCNFNASKASFTRQQWQREYFLNFMIRMSPSCQEMLKVCRWNLREIDCSHIFNVVITDIGACCSFNQLPLDYIFRNPLEIEALNKMQHHNDFQDWNFEGGYLLKSTNKTFPRVLKGPGLSVVLDTEIHNYYCSSTNSVGYQILVTNPNEIPRMQNVAINIAPGLESVISVTPVITDATQSIRSINIQNRQCYFNDEKYLMLYRTYTINNCIRECQINYTLRRCNCAPYFLLSNLTARMCEKEDQICQVEALELVALNEKPLQDKALCKCLPNCFELDYSKHMSYGRLSNAFQISKKYIRNETADYFVKNMAVLHIYFPSSSTGRLTKSEIYGHLELLSNMGGLLAIFLGFSFLSAAEIIYHLLCRVVPAVFHLMYASFLESNKVFPFTK